MGFWVFFLLLLQIKSPKTRLTCNPFSVSGLLHPDSTFSPPHGVKDIFFSSVLTLGSSLILPKPPPSPFKQNRLDWITLDSPLLASSVKITEQKSDKTGVKGGRLRASDGPRRGSPPAALNGTSEENRAGELRNVREKSFCLKWHTMPEEPSPPMKTFNNQILHPSLRF